ncbi:MAG TPA: cohesin domain-containing protein [Terracidiphilus sp.]|nr:cohesin domain-containing protein [Terracidiphilus sp.]
MKIREQLQPLAGGVFRLVLVAALAIAVFPGTGLHAQSARSDYKHGRDAEARQDYDTAFTSYQQAANRDPKNEMYRVALDRVRITAAATHVTKGRGLLAAGDMQGALAEFLHAEEIDPADEAAEQGIEEVRAREGGTPSPSSSIPLPASEQEEIDSMGAPPVLTPMSNEPLTLHMTEDAKVIYEAVGKEAGINVLFDPDWHSQRIQVDLNNVSLMDALRILETMSGSFWRPVTSNTIFVAQDTRIKRTELDEEAVQTFYLTNAWQQNDMNDVQTALRSILPNARFYGVASQNAIVARGTPDELLLAQKLVDDLDKARPEVVVDVAVLEVSKNWERTLGITWPSSVGVTLQSPNSSSSSSSSSTTGSTTTSPTLYDLSHLKASDFAVTVGSATLNLLLTNDNTQVLQNPSIRATDGQKATLTIGSKIPIATGSYSAPGLTATASIGYAQTQFQYIDVGVKIVMTPTVHYDNDVTLNMDIEVSSESGQTTIEGVTEPILSQEIINHVIRLREGQASILGGIQSSQTSQNWSGVPGLSAIPILKYLFGSRDNTIKDDDIVFVVVPHVVRSQELTPLNLEAVDTGSGQNVDLRMLERKSAPATEKPAAYVEPGVGVVPGTSAAGAAPAALQEMRTLGESGQPAPPPTPGRTAPPVANAPNAVQPARNTNAASAASPPAAGGGTSFALNAPPGPVAVGTTFQVPVTLNGGVNVDSIPLQVRYDPAHLALVNVTDGSFLNRDKQAVALVHRDDGPGDLTIVSSRPPGAPGISGSGVACVLTFQAKAAGTSVLAITGAGTVNSSEQQSSAGMSQVSITVK